MRRYRKKPVIIEAVRWNGFNIVEVLALARGIGNISQSFADDLLEIETLEGAMRANKGDWIIRGIKGELYPCKDDIFRATYEEVAIVGCSPVFNPTEIEPAVVT